MHFEMLAMILVLLPKQEDLFGPWELVKVVKLMLVGETTVLGC